MTDVRTTATLQTAALAEPVDPAQLRAYIQRLKAAGAYPSVFSSTTNVVGLVIGGAIAATVIVPTVFIAVTLSVLANGAVSLTASLFPILVVGVIAIGVVGAFAALRTARGRWYRLARFAEANGLEFWPAVPNPALPGLIFSTGDSRRSLDLVRDPRRSFEVANYRYTTGSGKSRSTHKWGYVAIRLRNPLPNIVLDATSNNTLFGSNLPAAFDQHQRLHLEGDFDRYFALYCPQGYERDALYLFTPDIMARFIDTAATLDVEIVDDRLILYAQRDLSTLDAATWQWIFSIVAALETKFAQWERWRDDRLAAAPAAPSAAPGSSQTPATPSAPGAPQLLRPPPGVAPQGRRLRRGVSWATIALVAGIALFWILGRVIEVAGFFN